jgi:O-antigen/teichoic acid export membrane protein
VLHGSAFILASRLINAASLFVLSVTLARYLGTELYGLIAIAVGVAGMFEVVGALGLNTGATRYIPYYRAKSREDDLRRVISINITAKVGTAILLGALLYISAGLLQDFFDKPIEPLMQIAAIVLAINVLGGAFNGILRGFQRMLVMAGVNIVRDIVWAATAIGLVVVADWGPEGALWGIVAGGVVWLVISLVVLLVVLREEVPERGHLEDRYDRKVLVALVTFGVPVLLSKLLWMVFDWTGTYVIAYFGTVDDVSIYNIAFGIVAIPLVLMKAISVAMLPALSQAYGEERMGLMQTLWGGSLKLINSIFMPLAVMLMVMAAPAILLVYGHDYVPGAMAVLILAPYLLVRPTGIMGNHILAAMAHQDLILKVNLVSVAINVSLSIAMVPAIGIEGAALAATIAFTFNSLMLHHYAYKKADVSVDHTATLRLLAGSMLAMAVTVGVFLLTQPLGEEFVPLFIRLAAGAMLGLGSYLMFVRRIRIFTDDEMENVRAVAKHSKLAGMILKLLGH